MYRDGYLRLFSVRRVTVFFHWTPLVVLVILIFVGIEFRQFLVGYLCVLAIILVHETGHALIALRLGYACESLTIYFFYGQCRHDKPHTIYEQSLIAWGGVLAQAAVIVVFGMGLWLIPFSPPPYLEAVVYVLLYLNAIYALFNLIPVKPLDGADAWKLPSIWYRYKAKPWVIRKLRRNKIENSRRLH